VRFCCGKIPRGLIRGLPPVNSSTAACNAPRSLRTPRNIPYRGRTRRNTRRVLGNQLRALTIGTHGPVTSAGYRVRTPSCVIRTPDPFACKFSAPGLPLVPCEYSCPPVQKQPVINVFCFRLTAAASMEPPAVPDRPRCPSPAPSHRARPHVPSRPSCRRPCAQLRPRTKPRLPDQPRPPKFPGPRPTGTVAVQVTGIVRRVRQRSHRHSTPYCTRGGALRPTPPPTRWSHPSTSRGLSQQQAAPPGQTSSGSAKAGAPSRSHYEREKRRRRGRGTRRYW
jgi:hypothetical protein